MSRIILIEDESPAEITYAGLGPATTAGGDSATMDFTDVDFGAEEPGKVVSLVVRWFTPGLGSPSRLMTSATIDGETAQIDRQQYTDIPFARSYVGIVSAMVEAASGPVSLTFEGAVPNNLSIYQYSIVGLVEYPTIVDADDISAGADDDVSVFLQTKTGGALIAGNMARNAANTFTLTGVTEEYDVSPFSNIRFGGGSHEPTTDEASREVRSQTTSTGAHVLVAVSYR